MKYGPVDVVVLALGEPKFDGGILAELEKLVSAGTVRVLDAMVLVKADDGIAVTLDIEDLPAEQRATLGFVETGTRGLFDAADAEILAEGLPVGGAIIAVAIENAWAVPLMNAFVEAGAEIAFTSRIPAVAIEDALAATAAGAQ